MNYQVVIKRNEDTLARADMILRTVRALGFTVEEHESGDNEFYISLDDDKDMAISLVIKGIGTERVMNVIGKHIK